MKDKKHKRKIQFSVLQKRIVEALKKNGTTTRLELAKQLDVHPNTIYDNLQKLLRKGLVSFNKNVRLTRGHPELTWFIIPTSTSSKYEEEYVPEWELIHGKEENSNIEEGFSLMKGSIDFSEEFDPNWSKMKENIMKKTYD